MKFLGLAIAAAVVLIPSSAKGEWVYIGADVKDAKLYVENTSITSQANQVLFLTDFHAGKGRFPAQAQIKASCKTGDFQLLTSSMQNDPNEVGPNSKVWKAPYGSLMGQAIQYVCSNH